MTVDTLFKNAKIYNVFLKEWSLTDVAVLKGKILFTGDSESAGLSSESTIDCKAQPLIPGLIDIHLHIESSLCTPAVFAGSVLPHGVTTVVSEPHEIANVFGLSGIEEMIRVSKEAVIDIFYGVPSSVPSTSNHLETTGGSVSSNDLEILMNKYPEVICLGEIMNYSTLIGNFTDIISGKTKLGTMNLINHLKKNYPLTAIEGHCPSVRNLDLAKLLYLGVDSDHCMQDIEGMKQRFASGMFVELQEKSITPVITAYLQNHDVEGLYSFVTDDVPPDILTNKGHLDYVVRKAMKAGLSLEKVIIATSLSPAKRMGFRDRGIIAPGKIADFILLKDSSSNFIIQSVYKRGVVFDQNSEQKASPNFSSHFLDSINLSGRSIPDSIFTIQVPEELSGRSSIECRVMRKNNKNTYTESAVRILPATRGIIDWTKPGLDLNLVVVIDRYSGKAQTAQGILDGVYIKNGAFCSSHAHDHHNILLAGDNIGDMKKALSWVLKQKGGMCVVSENRILASVKLRIGGILSEAPMNKLSKEVKDVQESLQALGIEHVNPVMSMCTLTLPVSPELKITDRGIVDTRRSRIVSLFADQG